MAVTLTADHRKVIGIALAVAALSLLITARYFHSAFPEASLDLKVDREDSRQIAVKFLTGRGLNPAGYRYASIFTYDDDQKLYLERSQGLARMNQLTSGPVRLWRWSHRWFRPQQKEEFSVSVTPSGEVAGFAHAIPEEAAGANLDSDAARRIAEKFVTQVMHRDLGDMEFLSGETTRRPARTDHSFTWKQKSVDLGDGSLRIAVRVQGDQVGSYGEYIKIPEQWSRDYEVLRSRNNSAQIVDELFFTLLSIAMAVALILRLRDRDVPTRTALGFAAVGALLYLLGQANSFSMDEFSYPTTDPFGSFVVRYITTSASGSLGIAVAIFLLVAAAEPVYREGLPSAISLRRQLSWKGLRTRSFLIANVVGLSLAAFFFAYQTLFYTLATKLGAWAPADIPFTNELNTAIPWASVLFMGFFPAVSEEMQFRAFAIPFLAKRLRSWPVAIVLAAFNWGFLHAAYPNQPFYIRGLEVGLGGVLIGFILLRFGIMATLIWHYSVDALYSAFLLLRSPHHYLMASGAITGGIMLLPLLTSLAAYWYTGTFEEEAQLTNAVEGTARRISPPPLDEAGEGIAYARLSGSRLRLAAVFVVIAVALACIPVYRFGQGTQYRLTPPEAARAADAYLTKQGVNPTLYRHVAQLIDNVDFEAVRYFLERRSLQATDQLYRRATQLAAWEVRYFRPQEIEEHHILVDPATGQIQEYRHVLDENAPGPSLSTDEARAIAERAVTGHGYKLSEFDLYDSSSEKRKARLDYTFVWQAKAGDYRNVGEAHYRVLTRVAGQEPVSLSDYFNLPEQWERQRSSTGPLNAVLEGVKLLFGLAVLGSAILVFVKQLRSGQIPWRLAGAVAAVVMAASALLEWNSARTLEWNYSTSIPLSTFWLQTGVTLALLPVVMGFGTWLVIALAFSLYPQSRRVLQSAGARIWRRDAMICVLVSLAAAFAFDTLQAFASQRFPSFAPLYLSLPPSEFNTSLPAAAYFLDAVRSAVFYVAAAGIAIWMFLWLWSHRPRWTWVAVLGLLVALGPSGTHSVPEFLCAWALSALSFGVRAGMAWAFFRDNILAYIAAAFSVSVAAPIVELLLGSAGFYRFNGALLLLLSVLLLAWLFGAWTRGRTNSGSPAASQSAELPGTNAGV